MAHNARNIKWNTDDDIAFMVMIRCYELFLSRSHICAVLQYYGCFICLLAVVCLLFDIAYIGDHLRSLWSWKNGDCALFCNANILMWLSFVNTPFFYPSSGKVHETLQLHQISSLYISNMEEFVCNVQIGVVLWWECEEVRWNHQVIKMGDNSNVFTFR